MHLVLSVPDIHISRYLQIFYQSSDRPAAVKGFWVVKEPCSPRRDAHPTAAVGLETKNGVAFLIACRGTEFGDEEA